MSVRISSNQILDAGIQSMDNSLLDAMNWQKKITSGNQFSKVSENAYAVSRGVRLEFDEARLGMFKTNQKFVESSHSTAQSQLDSIINEMNTLKQTFVQSQNGILNNTNYSALKIQAEQIRDAIAAQMTAQDGTGTAIFQDEVNQVQIEPNLMVSSGVTFSDAFGSESTYDAPTESQLYQSMDKFVTYLGEKAAGNTSFVNDPAAVSAGLDSSFDQLTQAQQRSGGISVQVDNAKAAISAIGTEVAATSSALLDTDMAAATAAYTRSQTILNAAQSMFARLQQSNLFSKL
jgi:flagellin-like hook-associated protein FlgL